MRLMIKLKIWLAVIAIRLVQKWAAKVEPKNIGEIFGQADFVKKLNDAADVLKRVQL